jgi:hypothetical protein
MPTASGTPRRFPQSPHLPRRLAAYQKLRGELIPRNGGNSHLALTIVRYGYREAAAQAPTSSGLLLQRQS